jgi:hypothetical protein
MKFLIRASLVVVSTLILLSPAGARPGHQIVGAPIIHLGPCGYGRVQKIVCGVRQHRPAPPVTICRKICVPA